MAHYLTQGDLYRSYSRQIADQLTLIVCRVVGATYAKGWLIIVGANKTSPVPGNGIRRRHARRRILPNFRALCGDNTTNAALRGLRMITSSMGSYRMLLELFGERMKKGKASLLLLSLSCLKTIQRKIPPHGCPSGVYIGIPPRGTMVIRLGAGPSRLSLRLPSSPPASGARRLVGPAVRLDTVRCS